MDPLDLLGLSKSAIDLIIKSITPKVKVNPKSIKLLGDWDSKQLLVVSNKTDKTLFGVQIMFSCLKSDNFEISVDSLDRQEEGIKVTTGSVTINTGVRIIDCMTLNNKKIIIIELQDLHPREHRKIYLSIKSSTNDILHIYPIKIDYEPPKVIESENKSAIPLQINLPYKEIKLKGIRFLVKKSS